MKILKNNKYGNFIALGRYDDANWIFRCVICDTVDNLDRVLVRDLSKKVKCKKCEKINHKEALKNLKYEDCEEAKNDFGTPNKPSFGF